MAEVVKKPTTAAPAAKAEVPAAKTATPVAKAAAPVAKPAAPAKAEEKKPEVKAAPAKVAAKPAAKAAPKAAVKKAAPKAAAKPAAKAAPKAAAKPAAKAAPKAAAAKKDVAPSVELQFNSGYNVKLDDVVASVKAACGKATGIKTFNIYVNQGEGKAFYVINGDITGSVDL